MHREVIKKTRDLVVDYTGPDDIAGTEDRQRGGEESDDMLSRTVLDVVH